MSCGSPHYQSVFSRGSSPLKTGSEGYTQLAYPCFREPSHEEPRCAQHPALFLCLCSLLTTHHPTESTPGAQAPQRPEPSLPITEVHHEQQVRYQQSQDQRRVFPKRPARHETPQQSWRTRQPLYHDPRSRRVYRASP